MRPEPYRGPEARILAEATERLRAGGPGGLRVTAVAAALGMTHANVYRHFASKAALVDAVTAAWLRPIEAGLREATDGPDPAADKLERLLIAAHRALRDRADADAALFALLVDASAQGRGVFRKHRAKVQAAILRVVEDGMATGALAQGDARRETAFVLDAMHRFLHPASIAHDREVPLPALEARFERVLRVVWRALAAGTARRDADAYRSPFL